ncbi:MAG: hypothetical protein V4501_06285 [Pseudomonadota bacterium]
MTEDYKFPVIDTIEAAWQKVSGAKGTVWAVMGFIFISAFLFGIIGGILTAAGLPNLAKIPPVLAGIVQLILTWGLIYIGIKRAADQPIDYGMVKSVISFEIFFKMIGVYLIQFAICGVTAIILVPLLLMDTHSYVGSIVAIILSVVWYVVFFFVLIRMYFAKAFVIDKRVDPWTAIKMSVAITQGNVLRIFCFLIICILAFIISAIPFGIGLIWSLPFLFIVYGLAYKRIMEKL